jgi:RNA polymerase sigma-70 factor (ECF subfamily)
MDATSETGTGSERERQGLADTGASWDEIARLHGEALLRWALRLTGDRAAAHDLVQDTYERALRRGLVGVPPARTRGWLFAIARNRFLDGERTRRSLPLSSLDESVHAAPDLGPLDEDEDDRSWETLGLDDIRRAVALLPQPQAEIYRLFAFEAMDYAAIAARLGIPVGTVGTRLLRARRRLRAALSRPEAGCAPFPPASHPPAPVSEAALAA